MALASKGWPVWKVWHKRSAEFETQLTEVRYLRVHANSLLSNGETSPELLLIESVTISSVRFSSRLTSSVEPDCDHIISSGEIWIDCAIRQLLGERVATYIPVDGTVDDCSPGLHA
jgi:hypothetical protein